MRLAVLSIVGSVLVVATGLAVGQAPPHKRLNPVIALLEQNKPVFGVYAPSNGGRRGEPAMARPALDLAKDALAYQQADFLFSGSLEGGLDRGYPAVAEFFKAMDGSAGPGRPPAFGVTRPMILKVPKIDPDRSKAVDNISRELNLGAAGLMFVETESAEEVRQGIAAMRFKSKGGTRADDIGTAAAHWNMTADQYRQKADLWPLNPDGELINWTIVESKEGLAHVREIAAVKGIGVLWPGAGTLRGVFSSTNAAGERVLDTAGWENAIQQVLSACKEFHVPCGFPATANDIELRMKQGFSVFVMNWGDAGFKTVDVGRKAAGR
ncbi:MAG TPA: aldolase/citrate lyase family protein [Vicinamibacterales bacterium]|jgi:4-hydroxy-2-oxoheptanedioate aldolase|nr:aldolase/citrate lyase family protein [Vicinamibacterales bacterium]